MSIFVTADTHFDHPNIIRHCDRPFENVDEMNQTLVDNWNAVVNKHDLVYILGDFAFQGHRHWIHATKGKKIIIMGNHDKMSYDILRLFKDVHSLLDIRIAGQKITMCHYPMVSWRASIHGSWHLYGHMHGRSMEYDDRLMFDVGVDVWNYSPVPWEVVCMKMQEKEQIRKEKWANNPWTDEQQHEMEMRVVNSRDKNRHWLDQYREKSEE